ncbi:hypothetical protein [Moorena sp. SIO3I6]|uniref:hypothetical protein n=1 Tax=Moorena sp. SIO3I6 TaxID=2607831 RepID=UPI0013FA6019|nr:hypothetical protein [Moorena sp. SIO3I6]NEP22618.1 hypothetical protein [Moorena sp. SIO3I6]
MPQALFSGFLPLALFPFKALAYILTIVLMQSLMGETTADREWGRPRQSLMGGTPKTALPPQDRTASPRPRCIAAKFTPDSSIKIKYYAGISRISDQNFSRFIWTISDSFSAAYNVFF